MRTEPYTPDEEELANCYAHVLEDRAGEEYATAKADAERGIAKVKADARIAAWKEVAEFMRTQTSDDATVLRATHLAATTIYYRASQIEQEEA